MKTEHEQAYLGLKADDRIEIRLPAKLKQHAELVARARNESVSQFVLEAVAGAVSEGLADVGDWQLTIPEQAELLKVLAAPAIHTPRMTAARKKAEQLFGPATLD